MKRTRDGSAENEENTRIVNAHTHVINIPDLKTRAQIDAYLLMNTKDASVEEGLFKHRVLIEAFVAAF
jgi:hypothetical protein